MEPEKKEDKGSSIPECFHVPGVQRRTKKSIFVDKDGLFGMRKFLAFTGGITFHCLSIAIVVANIACGKYPLMPDKVLAVFAGIFLFYFGKELLGRLNKDKDGR